MSSSKYDGISTSFENFFLQFSSLSALNSWTNETKAIIISNYLTGPALYFFQSNCDASTTYDEIINLLKEEFSTETDYAAQFYTTKQNQDETTLDYIYRMTLLAKKAKITNESIIIKQILSTLTFYNKRKFGTQIYNSLNDFKKAAKQENEIFGSHSQQLSLPLKIQTVGDKDTCLRTCSRGDFRDGTHNVPSVQIDNKFSDRHAPTDVFSTPVTSGPSRRFPPTIRPTEPMFSDGRGNSCSMPTQRPTFQHSERRDSPKVTQQPTHGYALRNRQQTSQDVRQQYPNARRH